MDEAKERVVLWMPVSQLNAIKERTKTKNTQRSHNKEILWIVSEFLNQEKGADQGTQERSKNV